MGFDGLKKKQQADAQAAAAAERQKDGTKADRDALLAALPGLMESAIKPALNALKLFFPDPNSRAMATYGDDIMDPQSRKPVNFGRTSKAYASFDRRFPAEDPGGAKSFRVGSAPIHFIVDETSAHLVVIAWDFRERCEGYVECAKLALDDITQDKIESVLDRIVLNQGEYAPPGAARR